MGETDGFDREIEPGIYEFTYEERGAAAAAVEQKRAEIIDVMRTSKCFTVTAIDDDDVALHSSFIVDMGGIHDSEEKDGLTFLSYATLKAAKDLATILNIDMKDVMKLLNHLVESGIADRW